MLLIVAKYAVTVLIIVAVSEIAKRLDKVGALIASLPLVTIMVLLWLFVEKQSPERLASYSLYTFWYVLPTLPMFLLITWMLNRGIHFGWALAAGCTLTFICFFIIAVIAKRFGVELMP